MSRLQLRFGLLSFLVLAVGVAGNLMLMQSAGRTAASRGDGERKAAAVAFERERQLSLEVVKGSVPGSGAASAVAKAGSVRPEAVVAEAGAGDHVETTRAIQRELQQRGYLSGAADGVPGLVTRAAIMAYEHDNGLPLTAEPSEDLLKRILLGASALPAKPATGKEKRVQAEMLVRTVQQALSGLGYNTGKVDGRLTDDTSRAIRDFESDNGMPDTGRISSQLVAKLAKLAGNGRLAASR